MRRRPTITVQPMGNCAPWLPPEKAIIRLRGKWVAQIFAPYTQLRVTREERNGNIVLVLEPLTLAKGDEPLKRE